MRLKFRLKAAFLKCRRKIPGQKGDLGLDLPEFAGKWRLAIELFHAQVPL